MSYAVNNAITDTFILRDASNTAITGKVTADFETAEAYLASTPATTATLTISEIGNAEYSITFTPTAAGNWTAHVVYNSGGVFKEFQETYNVVSTAITVQAVAISPTGSHTRAELRQRVADQLGDYLQLEATSASLSTSTFVDTLNISDAADSLTGRMLYVTSGANAGHIARITNTTGSTSTINFTPAADNLFSAGDTLDVVNERGRGWSIPEYHRAINAAITDAYPLGLQEFSVAIGSAFDADDPVIDVPDTLTDVYAVEWQDSDDIWWPLPRGKWNGWKVDAANGTIMVREEAARIADGRTIRLLGYGPYATLSDEDDATSLSPEWIVAAACARLCRQAVDRDSNRGSLVLLYQQDMDKYRVRIRTLRKTNTEHVRDA